MKRTVYSPFIFICLLLIVSCSTSKKNTGKTSWLAQKYHNLTSKYNGYFNANELYLGSLEKLKSQHDANYTQILPVYEELEGNPMSVSSDLDNAIKKSSIVIELHRPARWTDDAYLLIGKSHYLKQEYETAEEVFLFMEGAFNPDIKKRKYVKLSPKDKALSKKKELEEKQKRKEDLERQKQLEKEAEEIYKRDAARAKERERKEKLEEKKDLAKAKAKEREDKAKERKKALKQKQKEREQRIKDSKKNKGKSTPKKSSAPAENKTATTPVVETKPIETPAPAPKKEEKPKYDLNKINQNKTQDYSSGSKYPADEPEKPVTIQYKLDTKTSKKPKNYFWSHRPCFQESQLWLAKTYTERKKYEEAESLLKLLIEDPTTFKDIKAQAHEARGNNFIKTKNYSNAISALTSAVEMKEHKKSQRARLCYIIAQLSQNQGDFNKASDYFAMAAKLSTDYEMEFNAALSQATQTAGSDYLSTKEKLEKMLKDGKNKEYKADIYYALGNLAMSNGNKPDAKLAYQNCLRNDEKGSPKKTESYYQLANLSFQEEDYLASKNYFDSTALTLPKNDPRTKSVNSYQENLTEIAANITTIQLQDSLIKIAGLSEKERKALAVKLKAAMAESSSAQITMSGNKKGNIPKPPTNPNAPKSNFFAYDEKEVRKGLKEFKNKWGERKLEDNWRRSNKKSLTNFDDPKDPNALDIVSESQIAQITDQDLEVIFAAVPYSQEAKKISHEKIAKALYNLGILYKEKVQNLPKSIESYETLIKRFPSSSYEPEALFQLYSIYSEMNNASKAKSYLDLLLQKYPQSPYALAITDSEFASRRLKDQNKDAIAYDSAYTEFSNREYAKAYEIGTRLFSSMPKSHNLLPRVSLLNALCIGKLKGEAEYLTALKDLIAKYPNTDEQKRAREIMRLLGQRTSGSNTSVAGTSSSVSKFRLDPNDQHFVLAVIKDKDLSLNNAKAKISDFNSTYHQLANYQLSNMFLGRSDERISIVVIRRFSSKVDAMKYYEGAISQKAVFLSDKPGAFELFAIGQNNYRVMVEQESVDLYRDFFLESYLNE